MRGALSHFAPCNVDTRIIPADAGSTNFKIFQEFVTRDHPRGCGEHDYKGFLSDHGFEQDAGSSPRMRGARIHVPQERVYAVDHPRGCGEHSYPIDKMMLDEGSSPRMRGAPPDDRRRLCEGRIIPADAGSTRCSWTTRARAGDHPRGCGEHICIYALYCSTAGSSPRMRGAPRAAVSST